VRGKGSYGSRQCPASNIEGTPVVTRCGWHAIILTIPAKWHATGIQVAKKAVKGGGRGVAGRRQVNIIHRRERPEGDATARENGESTLIRLFAGSR